MDILFESQYFKIIQYLVLFRNFFICHNYNHINYKNSKTRSWNKPEPLIPIYPI